MKLMKTADTAARHVSGSRTDRPTSEPWFQGRGRAWPDVNMSCCRVCSGRERSTRASVYWHAVVQHNRPVNILLRPPVHLQIFHYFILIFAPSSPFFLHRWFEWIRRRRGGNKEVNKNRSSRQLVWCETWMKFENIEKKVENKPQVVHLLINLICTITMWHLQAL